MDSSRLPSWAVAALSAAVLLSSCSGGAVVPSGATAASGAGLGLRPNTKSCTQPADSFIFAGSCDTILLKASGGTEFLHHYRGIVMLAEFGARKHVIKSTPLTLVDATGKGDISPLSGNAFPHYSGSAGTPIVYFKLINGGPATKFSDTPTLHITYAGKLPGNTCSVVVLETTGWVAPGLTTTAKDGHRIQFPPFPIASKLPKGSSYFGVACQ
jgi:hypothetical protein